MNYNDNENIEYLSLAYSNIKNNIPDYIIINPYYKKYIINSKNFYFKKENYNDKNIEISNENINQTSIRNQWITICWIIIIFACVLLIIIYTVHNN